MVDRKPAPDFVRVLGLDCGSSQPIVTTGDESGFGSGGTITVGVNGVRTFVAGRLMDSLGESWSDVGFPTCQEAAATQ